MAKKRIKPQAGRDEQVREAVSAMFRELHDLWVRSGRIQTGPPQPRKEDFESVSDFVLACYKVRPSAEDLDNAARKAVLELEPWRALRMRVRAAAFAMCTAAKVTRLDPLPFLKLGAAMSFAPDHPPTHLDLDTSETAGAMTAKVNEVALRKRGIKAFESPARALDDLDRKIVVEAMHARSWIKTADLYKKVQPWKYGVGAPNDKNKETWRSRVAHLIEGGYLDRNKRHGKMVNWTGKQP
jgi:hypothetical protein